MDGSQKAGLKAVIYYAIIALILSGFQYLNQTLNFFGIAAMIFVSSAWYIGRKSFLDGKNANEKMTLPLMAIAISAKIKRSALKANAT